MPFRSLGLSAELLRAVADQGYQRPTPVQERAIPAILRGDDVMACAQTGTGKTASFVLPLLQRLADAAPAQRKGAPRSAGSHGIVRTLVLTPTRELAAQVAESASTYGRHLSLTSTVVYGGVKIGPQVRALRGCVDILVATPGRLLDHVTQRTVDLSRVQAVVLDEADRMLDMGFIHDIRKILALLPAARQSLLFSATFSDDVRQVAARLLKAPVVIEVARRNALSDTVIQTAYRVDHARKRELLSHLIGSGSWRQVLVFTRTKHGADRLARQLEQDGIRAAAIHGNKSQAARTQALASFKGGKIRTLVATDVAARGLDIEQLPHVVNFDLPHAPEDYVHRIGRTARAGASGAAISLVCIDEAQMFASIKRLVGRDIPATVMPGFEPDPSARPAPVVTNRRTAPRRPAPSAARSGPKDDSRGTRNGRPARKAHAARKRAEPRAAS